jgi:hypothetical protein
MTTPPQEPDRNQSIVNAVRNAFEPLTARLTPEVEPASLYILDSRFAEKSEKEER